jgi:hypothetical protein
LATILKVRGPQRTKLDAALQVITITRGKDLSRSKCTTYATMVHLETISTQPFTKLAEPVLLARLELFPKTVFARDLLSLVVVVSNNVVCLSRLLIQ